jgi:hypothetical protein
MVIKKLAPISLFSPMEESFQGICFDHAFFKACQYGTTREKVCETLTHISIKSI